MKIESKILVEFLTLSRMNELDGAIVNFSDNEITFGAMSAANTNAVVSKLKKETVKEYAAFGKLGIDSIQSIINILKKMKCEVDVSVKGNVMIVDAGKKTLEFELVDEKFIEPFSFEKEVPFDTIIKIPVEELIDFMDDISINPNETFFIETVDGGFKLYNKGKFKFTKQIKSEGTTTGTKVQFGEPFIKTLSSLTSAMKENKDLVIEMQLKSDYPATVFVETVNASYKFMIAPKVEHK